MRRITSFDSTLTQVSMLVHGLNNTGKTHFAAGALSTEAEHGKVLFVGVGEEPFEKTVGGAKIPGDVIHAETFKDLDDIVKEYQGSGLRAVALDSVLAVSDLCVDKITGGNRAPGGAAGEVSGQKEWGQIKFELWRQLRRFAGLAPFFFATCPSAINQDDVSQEKRVTPDLIGRQAIAIGGKFEFVGYMQAEAVGGGVVRRTIHFEPYGRILTRCNLPVPVTKPISLPAGHNGWSVVRAEFDKAFSN